MTNIIHYRNTKVKCFLTNFNTNLVGINVSICPENRCTWLKMAFPCILWDCAELSYTKPYGFR